MLDAKQVFAWLKLTAKQALILCFITSVLLFAKESQLSSLGLLEVKKTLQTLIGFAWLISIAVLVIEFIYPVSNWFVRKYKAHITLKLCKQRLHNLTQSEKDMLQEYIRTGSRTASFRISSGVVAELVSAGVIRRATMISERHDTFQYNIQPWAWDYLHSRPELLQ